MEVSMFVLKKIDAEKENKSSTKIYDQYVILKSSSKNIDGMKT